MNLLIVVLAWLLIVIASMAVSAYLARRWGHDPFGWALLSAVMGPIAVIAMLGTHQSDVSRARHAGSGSRVASRAIVLACDGSEVGPRMARYVAENAPGHHVIVVMVLPYEAESDIVGATRSATAAAAQTMAVLREAGISATLEVRFGIPAEEIPRFADDRGAALVVVGRRGAGLSRAMLGSVSDSVVAHARQPVVVVS